MTAVTQTVRCTLVVLLTAILVVSVAPAVATDMGQAAAAQVTPATYQDVLDNRLFTHDGDDRGYGPEHDLARTNIQWSMASFGLTVTLEPFEYSGDTYYNVVGTKLGTTYPDQEYIVGAHFDSVNNPGADDNASGTAAVLEAARVLSQYDAEYTLRFVAFDREEQGLRGSDAYVTAHITDDILGMISADMIAYNTGAQSIDIYGRSSSNTIKFALATAVETYGDGLASALHGSFDASDHAPFEWAGFPACLFIEDWGNPNYHTQLDSVDTPNYIDYVYATQLTRIVVGYLVDNAHVNVTMADGDFNADGFVDLVDFGEFDFCYTGAGGGPIDPTCEPGDFDADGDIDCADWLQFRQRWTGPPVDPPFYADCDLDCNNNSIADDLDIANATSPDCNANAIPDECDVSGGTSADCNVNAVPDECDLSSGTSQDCNANAAPDECDVDGGTSTDCNINDVPDECDLSSGASQDCNANAAPDECDIADGTSPDVDGNGIPDDCELAAPAASILGPRYLSVTVQPPTLAIPVALLLVGDPADADVSCVSAYVQATGELGAIPVYQTAAEWGTIAVYGEQVIPSTTYTVTTETETGVSMESGEVLTWQWGDVNNNGDISFVDINLVVRGFQGDFADADREAVDLVPCLPNSDINFADINADVAAFQGMDYWHTECAAPCP